MQPNKEGSATPAIQHQWTLTDTNSFDISGLCPGLDYQCVVFIYVSTYYLYMYYSCVTVYNACNCGSQGTCKRNLRLPILCFPNQMVDISELKWLRRTHRRTLANPMKSKQSLNQSLTLQLDHPRHLF